jgi:AbrB family looped-hinge helix DNA binding protein
MWYGLFMAHEITKEHYTLHLGNRGRIVLPAEVRHRLDLKEGDWLILTVEEDGSLRLLSARESARRGRGLLRQMLPGLGGRCLSEELIAERRAEASCE